MDEQTKQQFIIQFTDLADLLDEIRDPLNDEPHMAYVRLESLAIIEPLGKQGLAHRQEGVHVRAIRGNRILTWWVASVAYQTLHGRPFGKESEALARDAEETTQALAEEVREWLGAQGATVRSGVIALPKGFIPQAGTWPPKEPGVIGDE